jgi:polyferredoxin
LKNRKELPNALPALLIVAVYIYGSFMAVAVSYSNNGSVLWAMFHSLLSWVYVVFSSLGC